MSAKKSSSKTQVQKKPVLEEEKPSKKVKKASSEIDAIFSGKKRKKSDQKKSDQKKSDKRVDEDKAEKPKLENKSNKKKKITEDKEGRFSDKPTRSRKKTGDGLKIYTEEELGLSNANGGDTPLCPFDCECCF